MRLIFFLFIIASFRAYPHSQSPISEKDLSLTGSYTATVMVGNTSSNSKSFQIYLNGEKYGRDFTLGKNKKKKVQVFIKDLTPDSLEEHEICSHSIPNDEVLYITRVCTKYKILFPKRKIMDLSEKFG